ncbi:adenosylcobinamide-GDP ribazoletransferase [Sporosarcina sp. ACRSM]|uniref:adenosylcobinamide-GDP ribazoletransferase n=1 Tax=Sporosarcina sp. ACRSM TaxID=2918216 RepID=UPI001EF64666|nr:adenosylcobinamide-GDP ribazoletransferase [Sporosarcina sp. ACRSM]MCG7337304.1 adenosylcobinamide-GDP ribazoletransferase [Sporosarcina sp. ACRSM]
MSGIWLALQFFTSVPINKELPLGRKEVTGMYMALPFVGAAIGLVMYTVSAVMHEWLGMGSLLTAVFIVLAGIVLTGGLHLDGWADMGDAFFSYKDREQRLAILEDPRLGAFGTMALVLLIVVKIALFNELLLRGDLSWIVLLTIPLLARAGMNIYFATERLAKNKGLAHFFQEKMSGKTVVVSSLIISAVTLLFLGLAMGTISVPLALAMLLFVGIFLYRKWSLRHFGGVTGDLCGAFIEGMEALLWLTVLCFS